MYNRNIFAKYIRNQYIKDECELCHCTNNLELHHNVPFDELIHISMQLLNYKYYEDTDFYNENELKNIKLILVGLQITSEFTTLCDKCHDEIHSGNKSSISIVNIKRRKKDKILNDNINNILLPYLEEIVDKKLYTDEDKNKLKELFISVGIRGRTTGINTINKFLIDTNLKYILHSYKEKHRNNIYRDKCYWVIKTL